MKNAGNGLSAELVVAPAEQGAVVHLRLGLVAGDADGPVDDDVLRRNRQHLTCRVELPTVKKTRFLGSVFQFLQYKQCDMGKRKFSFIKWFFTVIFQTPKVP